MSRNVNLNFGLVPAVQTKFRKITSIRTTVSFLSNKPSQQKHQLLFFIDRVTTIFPGVFVKQLTFNPLVHLLTNFLSFR
jgi:hypothetical protein